MRLWRVTTDSQQARSGGRRGMIAVAMVLILLTIQVLVLSLSGGNARDQELLVLRAQGSQAFYGAEAAVAYATREFVNNLDYNGDGTIGAVSGTLSGQWPGTTTTSVVTGPSAAGLATLTLTTANAAGGISRTTAVSLRRTTTNGAAGLTGLAADYWQLATAPSVLASVPWSSTPTGRGSVDEVKFTSVSNSSAPLWRWASTNGQWGARYSGTITIPSPGTWTFWTESDDGSDLTVNGTLVVNNDGLHAPTSRSGTIAIAAAGSYTILARFFENGGGHAMTLYWRGPAGSTVPSQVPIPPSALQNTTAVVPSVQVETVLNMSVSAIIDGFDSTGGLSSPAVSNKWLLYADVFGGSNNRINMSGSATIAGSVQIPPGTSVSSSTVNLQNSSTITGGATVALQRIAIERASNYTPLPASSGALNLWSSLTQTITGTVRFTSATLSGSSRLNVAGDAILIIDGNMDISGASSIVIPAGSSLRIYCGGNLTVSGTSTLNTAPGSRPAALRITMYAAAPLVNLTNDTRTSARLHAPTASVSINSTAVLYGALKCDALSITNSAILRAEVGSTASISTPVATTTQLGWVNQ